MTHLLIAKKGKMPEPGEAERAQLAIETIVYDSSKNPPTEAKARLDYAHQVLDSEFG